MQFRNIAILLFFVSSALSAQPISKALRNPHPSLERLERAIKKDRNPGHINPIGDSFLHVAAKRNLGEHIARLMEIPEINDLYLHQNSEGQTAIEIAIMLNAGSAFNALVGHLRADDEIRVDNPQGWSLLHLAASLDRAEMIEPLIVAGIPVNTEDNRGWSALDIAGLFYADNTEWVLIKQGAESTNKDDLEVAHSNAKANYASAHQHFLQIQRETYKNVEFHEEEYGAMLSPLNFIGAFALPKLCDVMDPRSVT